MGPGHCQANGGQVKTSALLALHPAYAAATPEQLAAANVNGCGPGGWRIDLVPDHLGKVDYSEACRQHDYLYFLGGTEEDRLFADTLLYVNIAASVLLNDGYLVPLQMAAAAIFYRAVRNGGAKYFGVHGRD